ncbi:DUF1064 domain-containing protein [Sporolactobacillus terrae]|uniref:DUF1064 domain-containing protein n=1 Tax=Sporolactobacillus terrae TaxID=269673 RepID=UPI0006846C10|nr:DUF1064 domain-containing protein [Sporolactobacillus terrae]
MDTMTLEQYKNLRSGRRKRNKYNAKQTTYNGVRYDSRMEAQFAAHLDKQLKAGEIDKIVRQPHYVVLDAGETEYGVKYNKVIYTPDFLVTYQDGHQEAIEVKGKETRDYLVRKKLFYSAFPWIPLKVVTYTKRTGWIELDELKKLRAERRKAKKAVP